MIQSLQLRYSATADATPDAWFLPGNSPERWLEELSRCGLAGMETRLFIVPRSIVDRSCAGLLVVPDRAHSVLHPPAAVACRLIAGRLFIPVDALLHPPVTDSEVRTLCPLSVSFFHPVFGLSGFDEESTLRTCHLLQAPDETKGNWNFARPGIPPLPELNAVVLLEPPSIDDIFGDAQDEIGTESPENLPPLPDEPKEGPLSKTGRTLKRFFLKSVAEGTKQMPHTGRHRTWINDLEDWANNHLRGVSKEDEQLRHKEIHRLLHLLDTDAEAGLRHAIPMNNFAHRGTAPPSNRLGSRSLNFDPRRLGGGPADFWNIPLDLQQVLLRRYREMADREMQLGRHRRAAYIYAELLGDLVSAANALKQGRLYREAALLYEEHLKNPLEAARCLAEGGLLAEAIERYEKLGRWLDIADLHQRAGDLTAAHNAIRRVINERLSQNDILGAAKLVEERLHADAEALDMLLGAWPSSHQAINCLGVAFQIFGRLGQHEAALERVAQFSREPVPESITPPLVGMLAGIARDYPNERVRHRASDISRVLIARELNRPTLASDQTGRLLEHLVRLAPQDRLLSRDSNRYLAARRSAERVRHPAPPPQPGQKPVLLRRFELPRQIQWLQLRREWHWFYALGVTPKRLTLVRGVWEGEHQSLSWDCSEETVKHGFVFEPTGEQGRAVALARADGHQPLPEKKFPPTDLFFNKECLAGTPRWLPTQGYPFAFGEDAVWTVHLASGRAVLSCYGKGRGQLLQTADITDDLLHNATRTSETRLALAVLPDGIAVALGNRLLLKRNGHGVSRVDLPGQAVGLVPTIPSTRQGVAVMLQSGAVMCWVGSAAFVGAELDRDIQSPLGAFVPGGPLVLVSGFEAILLDVDSRGVHNVTRLQWTGQRAVGVSATSNPGEFAVLGERGEMTIYRIPR